MTYTYQNIYGNVSIHYTQRNLFEILLNQTQIRLYLPSGDFANLRKINRKNFPMCMFEDDLRDLFQPNLNVFFL